MKKILMIATGGTIACKFTESGLMPQMNAEEILEHVPSLYGKCEITTLQLMNIDSTNMSPSCWLQIARCIETHYADYDGFVVTHGTDTMAYTASALSYLIQHAGKPIIVTGSQRSIFLEDTDARRNLHDAFIAAMDGTFHGVFLVFDGQVICGTRARKMRTKSMNAFSSIDYPEAALIMDEKIFHYLPAEPGGEPVFFHSLNENIFVLRLIPGMNPEVLIRLADWYDGIIIESFGVGGLPCYESRDFLNAAAHWSRLGKPIVIATQVPHEGSDLSVYEVGARAALLPGVMQAQTMTIESTVTKLMWILGQHPAPEEVEELFYTPIAHDLLVFESAK